MRNDWKWNSSWSVFTLRSHCGFWKCLLTLAFSTFHAARAFIFTENSISRRSTSKFRLLFNKHLSVCPFLSHSFYLFLVFFSLPFSFCLLFSSHGFFLNLLTVPRSSPLTTQCRPTRLYRKTLKNRGRWLLFRYVFSHNLGSVNCLLYLSLPFFSFCLIVAALEGSPIETPPIHFGLTLSTAIRRFIPFSLSFHSSYPLLTFQSVKVCCKLW